MRKHFAEIRAAVYRADSESVKKTPKVAQTFLYADCGSGSVSRASIPLDWSVLRAGTFPILELTGQPHSFLKPSRSIIPSLSGRPF